MKKIITFSMLFLVFYSVNCQIIYGIEVGTGLSELTGEDIETAKMLGGRIYNPLMAYQFGITVNKKILEKLQLESGLTFKSLGYKEKVYLHNVNPNEEAELDTSIVNPADRHNYISIPLLLKTNLIFPDWMTLNIGFNNNFYMDRISNKKLVYPIKKYYVGIIGGIGFSYKQIGIDIEYSRSIKQITKPIQNINETLYGQYYMIRLKYILAKK